MAKLSILMLRKLVLISCLFISLSSRADDTLSLASPNHIMQVQFYHQPDGGLQYSVIYKGRVAIKASRLGMKLKDPDQLLEKFDLLNVATSEFDETWKPVWGEV